MIPVRTVPRLASVVDTGVEDPEYGISVGWLVSKISATWSGVMGTLIK